MAARSQTGLAGLAKSDRAISIRTQADISTAALIRCPGATAPKGNKTAPTTPNARVDVGPEPVGNNVTDRRVAGNRHRPSPINSAPRTPWTCKRTAYIGPYTADNVTSHSDTSANGKTIAGFDVASSDEPIPPTAASKANRIGITTADATTRIAATMCQRVVRATARSYLGDNSHGCHGSSHLVSAYANNPKGTNRMRNAMESVRTKR